MLCQEGRPLLVTVRVPFVSVAQVGSSDPLEQPLTLDDYSSQRTEQEPIPNPDDNDRDGAHTRPSDCDLSLTHETRHKTQAHSILLTLSLFGGIAPIVAASVCVATFRGDGPSELRGGRRSPPHFGKMIAVGRRAEAKEQLETAL
jgi:hypothetical protein